MTPENIIAFVVALFGGGGVGALLTARNMARKTDVDALCATIVALQAENKRLCDRMEHLEQRVRELEAENRGLRGEL